MRKSLTFAGMGVGEMSEYLGVTRETVSRWMNGKNPVGRQSLRLWALRTGVPFEWLETGNAPSPHGDGACPQCAIRDLNPEPADKRRRTPSVQLTELDIRRWRRDVARVERAA